MNLTTSYLGFSLKNPIIASASPLTENIDNIRRLEDAGAAAIVMHSLFEEQIIHESHLLDHFLDYGSESYGEALSYFPNFDTYNMGPEEYLKLLEKAKKAVDIPVIGSLNGISSGGWTKYARHMEEAGADALELNIYFIPTNPDMSGVVVERIYEDVVREVKESVSFPVAVKISHFFSSIIHTATRLEKAGADALVLFNRFYQPDFNLRELEVVPNLHLSNSYELLLRLHWVAILYGHVLANLAITGGVHTAEDVLKASMAGARVAMMTSALLKNGIDHLGKVLVDLRNWMEENEYESIRQMQGSMSQLSVANPAAFERSNYMKVLGSFSSPRESPPLRPE